MNPDTPLSGASLLAIGLSLVCVAGLMLSDYRDYRPGRYLFKPLAALAFVKPQDAVAGGSSSIAAIPAPEVRYIPYPVVEHTGFVPASDERGNRYYQTSGPVPAFFLSALRNAGHDVRHVERLIDIPREEGDPLQLPITETRVFVNHQL